MPSAITAIVRPAAYGLAAVLVAFELWVGWLVLNPDPDPAYRAYYLDQTSRCLAQPVSGAYAAGTTVLLTMADAATARPLMVCGWIGPGPAGIVSVGETSRLRFAFAPVDGPLALTLRAIAAKDGDADTRQRVDVSVNGETISHLAVRSSTASTFRVLLPPELVSAAAGHLEVSLDFPDAIRLRPWDTDTGRRAIRLLSVVLGP